MLSIHSTLLIGFLIRFAAIAFGSYLDASCQSLPHFSFLASSIQYTDIDYSVFSDAAYLVYSGRSPYERETYRYNPFLYAPSSANSFHRAYLLVPNHLLSPLFGKVLFSVFDILCGYLIYVLLCGWNVESNRAVSYASLWTLNPFVLFISTRGSADTIVCFLLFLTLVLLQRHHISASAIVYGLAVHFKLYPIIYALILFLYCRSSHSTTNRKNAFTFAVVSSISFLFFCSLSWWWYGSAYLREAWFYHAQRVDIRHNYSLLFYPFYLLQGHSPLLGRLAWLPQLLLLFLISVRLYSALPLAITLATLVFVAFNRVVTAQYFLWWLAPLVLEAPFSSLTAGQWIVAGLGWVLAQNVWNAVAYGLEFEGADCFRTLWLACLLFFAANCGLCVAILRSHRGKRKVD